MCVQFIRVQSLRDRLQVSLLHKQQSNKRNRLLLGQIWVKAAVNTGWNVLRWRKHRTHSKVFKLQTDIIAARGGTDGQLCCGSFLSFHVHLFKARGRDGTPTGTFMHIHRKPEAGGAAARDPLSTEQSAVAKDKRIYIVKSEQQTEEGMERRRVAEQREESIKYRLRGDAKRNLVSGLSASDFDSHRTWARRTPVSPYQLMSWSWEVATQAE